VKLGLSPFWVTGRSPKAAACCRHSHPSESCCFPARSTNYCYQLSSLHPHTSSPRPLPLFSVESTTHCHIPVYVTPSLRRTIVTVLRPSEACTIACASRRRSQVVAQDTDARSTASLAIRRTACTGVCDMPKRSQTNQDKGKRKQRSDGQSGQREARTKGKRLAYAKEAITKALEAGDCLDSHEDIVRILRRYLRDRDLPKDHFDVLDSSDHCNLYIDIIKSQNQIARPGPPSSRARTSHTHHAKFSTPTVPQSPDSGTVIRHGQVTPVPSATSTDCDAQSEGRAEQE